MSTRKDCVTIEPSMYYALPQWWAVKPKSLSKGAEEYGQKEWESLKRFDEHVGGQMCPYPLDTETAAALEGACRYHILSWEAVRNDYINKWVRDHYLELGMIEYSAGPWNGPLLPGPLELSPEFEEKGMSLKEIDETEVRVTAALRAMVDSGAIRTGAEIDLSDYIPVGGWVLKSVPLVNGEWADRHVIELAEWTGLLKARKYTRLPPFDTHHLAWDRFYPPRTDWSNPKEVSEDELITTHEEAKDNLRRFPGAVAVIDGREYLHFAQYRNWEGRKVRASLMKKRWEGVVVSSWNTWWLTNAANGGTEIEGIGVEIMGAPYYCRKGPDFKVVKDRARLTAELRRRREVLARYLAKGHFIFTPLQKKIMEALEGRVLKNSSWRNGSVVMHEPCTRKVGCQSFWRKVWLHTMQTWGGVLSSRTGTCELHLPLVSHVVKGEVVIANERSRPTSRKVFWGLGLLSTRGPRT